MHWHGQTRIVSKSLNWKAPKNSKPQRKIDAVAINGRLGAASGRATAFNQGSQLQQDCVEIIH